MTATVDVNGSAAPTRPDLDQALQERLELACRATYQIDALIYMLRREISHACRGHAIEEVGTSALIRLKDLNNVVLSLVGDEHPVEMPELEEIVTGRWPGEDA